MVTETKPRVPERFNELSLNYQKKIQRIVESKISKQGENAMETDAVKEERAQA